MFLQLAMIGWVGLLLCQRTASGRKWLRLAGVGVARRWHGKRDEGEARAQPVSALAGEARDGVPWRRGGAVRQRDGQADEVTDRRLLGEL